MRNFTEKKLLVATHNDGKLEEIRALLKDTKINTVSSRELGLTEPAETENTFIGNARIKAHSACKHTGLPSISDDSGLEIEDLDFQPGVYSADWAETPNGRDFNIAMKKIWSLLNKVNNNSIHIAKMRCTMVLAWPDGHEEIFEGSIKGKIVWPMRGTNGHGYDPIFQPDGYKLTFGEMDRWVKNRLSHRAEALNKLLDYCIQL